MLNKQGIRDLARQLIANASLYDQNTFGEEAECGTVGCLAGFCLLAQIGFKSYARRAKNYSGRFNGDCRRAGVQRLGIESRRLPIIFFGPDNWPPDLCRAYDNAPTGKRKVKVALLALQRLLPNGEIDPDPKAIHTPLKRYLNQVAPKKKKAA